jgi:competence protein ComEC
MITSLEIPVNRVAKSALVLCALVTLGERGNPAQGTGTPNQPANVAELVIRVLDVGQGDAVLVENGGSRVLIDGGPDMDRFGQLLDSLDLNGKTIDVVILSHQHYDHYSGLRNLFERKRKISVRYFFENRDPAPAISLAKLRDSVLARSTRGELIYRDTDDPCANGQPICTITLRGGARLHILRPNPKAKDINDRSVAVKIVGPDSASFTMWLAGDTERAGIRWFDKAGYARKPGMQVSVLKANHHGSCNGAARKYLRALRPEAVIASLAAVNDYGFMHDQTKSMLAAAGIPWYRTDQNGTITIRTPGTPGGGYSIRLDRGRANSTGPTDRVSKDRQCRKAD